MIFNFSDRINSVDGGAINEILSALGDPKIISLAGGNPAPELFPGKELAEIASKLLTERPVLSLQYNTTEGYSELREQVKARLRRKENIDVEKNDVIIFSGSQQAIDISTAILTNEGDTIIVEEPSFIGALNSFRAHKVNLAGVPMDNDGINTDMLEEVIKANRNVKMMYLIPTFQNPTGLTMSQKKREEVYRIAQKYNLIIIEDDPYGNLKFDDTKYNTLKSMDCDGRVIYCGTFSKILSPGIRVGYMCASPEITAKAAVAKQAADVHTSIFSQLLVSEYMKKYDIEALIEKMRALYREKCGAMLKAIDTYFPSSIVHTNPKGGLFVWATLPEKFDTFTLSKKCIQNNVAYVPGCTFMVDMTEKNSSLRLNYSTMPNERIIEGIKILGKIFSEI